MKGNRTKIIAGLLAILFVALFGYFTTRPKEPTYEGKTLTQWLKEWRPEPEKALTPPKALVVIGTNGIPTLINLLAANDSTLKSNIIRYVNRHRIFNFRLATAREKHFWAVRGLYALGPKIEPAFPHLLQLLDSPDSDTRMKAFSILMNTSKDQHTLTPHFLKLIKDPDPAIASSAANFIHVIDPAKAEASGVYQLFPNLKPTSEPAPSTETPP